MKTIKAYRIFEEGGRSSGRLTEVAPDELDGGELLIRATYSSINYKDALAATGTGKVVRRFPLIGGIDVAGVVDASSDGRFEDRKSTRLNSSHANISYAVFCLKKKKNYTRPRETYYPLLASNSM